jgi:hypothetical protein
MTRLFLFVFLSAASAWAAPINLCSDLVDEGNNSTGVNVAVVANPAWAVEDGCAKWISFANTGDGGSQVANADTAGPPTTVFFENFILGSNRTGTVTVWADDTARIRLVNSLNPGDASAGGILLAQANPVQDGACAAGGIACEPHEGLTIVLDSHLTAGLNTLYIDAYQRGGGPFAIMYTGQADSTMIPEPGTYVLLGTGLVGFWLARRRKIVRPFRR